MALEKHKEELLVRAKRLRDDPHNMAESIHKSTHTDEDIEKAYATVGTVMLAVQKNAEIVDRAFRDTYKMIYSTELNDVAGWRRIRTHLDTLDATLREWGKYTHLLAHRESILPVKFSDIHKRAIGLYKWYEEMKAYCEHLIAQQ